MELDNNIKVGQNYEVTVKGYDLPDYIFIEFENGVTGYIDMSAYKYSDADLINTFRVNYHFDVFVVDIDTTKGIICELMKGIRIKHVSTKKPDLKKSSEDKPQKKNNDSSEGLTHDLKSIMSEIKLDN